tara:strand:+ start:52398 stop:52808 length:411 start_codon:yes stop_codon:yes gene_type:complete
VQRYENILNDFLGFCESKKYDIASVDKLYEKEKYKRESNIVLILARVALYKHVPLLIELYSTKSIGLFFNLFECDPLSASLFTKEFMEKEVDIISAFVEMKDTKGKLTNILFGEEAFNQFIKEKKNKSIITPNLLN